MRFCSIHLNKGLLALSLCLFFACKNKNELEALPAPIEEPEPELEPEPEPEPMPIEQTCDSAKSSGDIKTITKEFEFQATYDRDAKKALIKCPWGEDDNEEMKEYYLTAYHEQSDSVEIGEENIVCELKFDFSKFNSQYTDMRNDDIMFITMGAAVGSGKKQILLSSSYNYNENFEFQDGFYFYSWKDIVGKLMSKDAEKSEYPFKEETYCIGGEKCKIPGHDETGPFHIEISEDLGYKIAEEFKNNKRLDFSVIVTGDNNPGTDCTHDQPILFDIEIKVAPKMMKRSSESD